MRHPNGGRWLIIPGGFTEYLGKERYWRIRCARYPGHLLSELL